MYIHETLTANVRCFDFSLEPSFVTVADVDGKG
jgi:hypothetical protein